MKQPFSEEILSAFVDDELAAPERAAVEQWLEEDPEARNKLDEFRRLSGLFADLPRSEVPPEFPTNVLRLAERQMLLAEARPAKSRSVLRRWALAGGSSIAAAVVLGLALHLYQPIDRPPQRAIRFDDRDGPAGASVIADNSRSLKGGAVQDLAPEGVTHNFPPASGPQPADQPAQPATPGDSLESDGRAPAMARSGGASRANAWRDKSSLPELGAVQEVTQVSALQQDQIDKAMEEIGKAPDAKDVVAVVKLHVVDRAEGLVLVQHVLAESQIPIEEDAVEESGKSEFKVAAKPAATAASGNEALYVVAEPEQLVAAFAAILAREKIASGLEVADPIEVAALDESSKKRLQQVESEFISNVAPAKPAAADGAKKSDDAQPAASGEGKSDKKPGQESRAAAGAERKSSSKSEAGSRGPQKAIDAKQYAPAERGAETRESALADAELSSAPGWQGRQTVVNYPQQASNERGRAGVAGKESAGSKLASPSREARGSKKDQTQRDEDGEGNDRSPALVRVLIVVEESAK
jgi:hypothetical protein